MDRKEQLTEQKWIDHLDGKEPSLASYQLKMIILVLGVQ